MVVNPVPVSMVVLIFNNNSSTKYALIGGCGDRKVKKRAIEPGSPGRGLRGFP